MQALQAGLAHLERSRASAGCGARGRGTRYGFAPMSPRPLTIALVLTVLLAGCGSSASKSTPAKSTTPAQSTTTPAQTTTAAATTPAATSGAAIGAENVPLEAGPLIAPASTTRSGVIDGLIKCAPLEQLAYHIHAHLAVFVDGQPRALPAGIGIPDPVAQSVPGHGSFVVSGKCFYYLHTHAQDGIIHIESPTQRIYTLGQFFDEWHQPLSGTVIGTIHGSGTWIVNGKTWKKSPRDIPLTPHADVQLDIGQPAVPFRPVNWSVTQL
jgi:hypothetical protein